MADDKNTEEFYTDVDESRYNGGCFAVSVIALIITVGCLAAIYFALNYFF